jgi:hypothetical protein
MPSALSPARAILYGGLTAGALDLLDAFIFFCLPGALFASRVRS